MRNAFAPMVAAATLLVAGAASAQPPGTSGQVALGADRLFGYTSVSETVEDDAGNETKTTVSSVGILGNAAIPPFNVPRAPRP